MLPDRDEEESGRGGDSDEHSEMDDDNEEHSIEIKRKASGRLRRRPFISSLQNSAESPEESIEFFENPLAKKV